MLNITLRLCGDDVHAKEGKDQAPTCTAEGQEWFRCTKCRVEKMEKVPALGHSPVLSAYTAPTCEESGSEAYYSCSRCGRYFTDPQCRIETTVAARVLPPVGPAKPVRIWPECKSPLPAAGRG